MRLKRQRWYHEKTASICHAYDGFGIYIQERNLFLLLIEKFRWAVADMVAPRFIWFDYIVPKDYAGYVEHNVFCWIAGGKVHGAGKQWTYPVVSEWVFEQGFWEKDSFDESDYERDPDHGTKCLACQIGYINEYNIECMKVHGVCMNCWISAIRSTEQKDERS
jgi:hypothetical protein